VCLKVCNGSGTQAFWTNILLPSPHPRVLFWPPWPPCSLSSSTSQSDWNSSIFSRSHLCATFPRNLVLTPGSGTSCLGIIFLCVTLCLTLNNFHSTICVCWSLHRKLSQCLWHRLHNYVLSALSLLGASLVFMDIWVTLATNYAKECMGNANAHWRQAE
jgi:hypothetical protein